MDLIRFLEENNVNQKLVDDALYFRNIINDEQYRDMFIAFNFFLARKSGDVCGFIEAKTCNQRAKPQGKTFWPIISAFYGGDKLSFHINTDSSTLIGTDTFIDNRVQLRKGAVYACAEHGGFGVFDEINMAKNDAIVVLHSALDYRRFIDIPGYEKIALHEATRFMATMNYEYAGTKELNKRWFQDFL